MELIKQVNKNGIAHPFAGVSTKYNNGMAMVSFLKNGNGNISKEARQANGVIFENGNSNPKLLHYSFEKCYDTRDDLYTFKPGEKYDVGLYFEGSIIKLFWYKETWNVSTSRGIDAKTNFWISEKSFFELFVECVEKSYSCNYQFFLDSLEKNSFYTFLMCHPENDNNCKDSLPMAYCLNKVTPEYDSNQDIVNLNEFLPEEDNLTVKKDIDKQELDNFLVSVDRTQNYMIFVKNGKEISRIKVLSTLSYRKSQLTGTFPDLGLGYARYLSKSTEFIEKHEYHDLFPQYVYKFEEVDRLFSETAKEIHNFYIKKNVRKEDIEIPTKYQRTLYQLHCQYRKTKKQITISDVEEKLSSLNPWLLCELIGYKF